MEPEDFADLRIVGLDEDMTAPSVDRPELRLVFLRLSHTPPPVWRGYFDERRKISRHPHWRKAWIDRKFIVVECVPEEIETYHLRDLKEDVAAANLRCHAYFRPKALAEKQKHMADHHVRDRLRDIKGRLKFD